MRRTTIGPFFGLMLFMAAGCGPGAGAQPTIAAPGVSISRPDNGVITVQLLPSTASGNTKRVALFLVRNGVTIDQDIQPWVDAAGLVVKLGEPAHPALETDQVDIQPQWDIGAPVTFSFKIPKALGNYQ